MSNEIYIFRSSAKVNLTLDVLALRSDGYHELQSVVHTIGLWDELHFEFGRELELRCNRPELANDNNLCLKAVRAWLEKANINGLCTWRGVRITLQKNIPSGAGLGGGSGNAAATLMALQTHFPGYVSTQKLHQIASKLGADVPLFLHGGCMLMEGIGEKLSSLPSVDGWLVVLQPPGELSTPVVYRAWDEMQKPSACATPHLLQKLNAQPESAPAHLLANALQNDLSLAAPQLGLNIAPLLQFLRHSGALDAQMTGSGSAVFGVFAQEHEARSALQKVREQGNAANFELRFADVAPFCLRGVEQQST